MTMERDDRAGFVRDAALDLDRARDAFALITRKGLGAPVAGFLYWIAASVLVRTLPQRPALIAMFVLTAGILPLAIGLTRAVGGDFLARGAFGGLGALLALVQIAYWPVIVLVWRVAPDWTTFVMVVLFGSHFLPYGWLYRSRAYIFLGVSFVVAVVVAAVLTRGPIHALAPPLAAVCYLIGIALLVSEVAALKSRR